MKPLLILGVSLPVLCLVSCRPSLTLTVHDEDAAALVSSNFLRTAFYERKPGLAYETTDTRFKSGASKTDFVAAIEKIQADVSPGNFVITDYSTWGAEESIGIYGHALTTKGVLIHFRCLLTGTMSKGYSVTRLDCSPTLPKKTGVNMPFKQAITLQPLSPNPPVPPPP